MRRNRSDYTDDPALRGNDLQALRQNGLTPPAADWLKMHHAVIGNAGGHKTDFIHMSGHHDFRALIVTAEDAEQAS
ncbi:hypothetical protein D3C73_1234740 [compost metagenome]